MRKETSGKELVRAGVTRFATTFLTLRSIYSHKAALRSLFVSRMWLQIAWAKKPEGKKVVETILSTSFWKGVCNCLRAGEPLVQVLRLADSDDKPPMGYLYQAAEMANDKIKVYFDFNEKAYKPIIDIIDRRFKDQLYQDLYLAGYFFNLICYYAELERNPQVAGKDFTGFMSCVDRMVEDPGTRVTIMCQVNIYKFAHGPFSKDMAIRLRDKKQPHLWWDTIGNETIELKDVAVRILRLTCTSSASERNLSTFEYDATSPGLKKPAAVTLNFLDLPIRPRANVCRDYMRTGNCTFGVNCKYHHPDPAAINGPDPCIGYQNGIPAPHSTSGLMSPTTSSWLVAQSVPPYTSGMNYLSQGFNSSSEWKDHTEEYPNGPGQPRCQHYTESGVCMLPSSCKFCDPDIHLEENIVWLPRQSHNTAL